MKLSKHALGLILTAVVCVDSFAADVVYRLNITAEPLSAALEEFAEQTGLQVAYFTADAAGEDANPVVGAFTANDALKRLLAGTRLIHEDIDSRTVTIRQKNGKAIEDAMFVPRTRAAIEVLAQNTPAAQSPANQPNSGQQSQSRPRQKTEYPSQLEEVIVTAQKRGEERLLDVPIAISVVPGIELERSNVQDVTEMLARQPGVSIDYTNISKFYQVQIRGVSVNLGLFAGASTVAYYIDSVPFGFVKTAAIPNLPTYDLERVEVLRGPQGTLYGANALNGVVRVLTKDPNPGEFEFKMRTSASMTKYSDEGNYRGDVAINVPIIEGKLAARAVLGYQRMGGWIDKPNIPEEDTNDAEIQNMRLKIKATPNDRLTIGASVWLNEVDYFGPNISDPDHNRSASNDEPTDIDFDSYDFTITYDFPSFSLKSMTSYVEYDNQDTVEVSGGRLFHQTLDAQTFAQEVNVVSTSEGDWGWSIGGMYRDSSDNRFVDFRPNLALFDDRENTSESTAVFGELTRYFHDGRFELTGGLRYYHDRVGIIETSRLGNAPPPEFVDLRDSFDDVTPRVVLKWHPQENLTTYASYSEGFRSGVFQAPAATEQLLTASIEPDNLHNYEVGFKGLVLEGQLEFDSAIFYIDWQDVQRQIRLPDPLGVPGRFITGLVNGDSASGPGVEFGLTSRPIDQLTLGLTFAWNDLESDADVFNGPVILFPKGGRLAFSPEITSSASVSYVFPFGNSGFEGRISASGNYTSARTVFEEVEGMAVARTGEDFFEARANFSVAAPDNSWVASLFVENLFNQQDNIIPTLSPFPEYGVSRPRTIGLQFEYRR